MMRKTTTVVINEGPVYKARYIGLVNEKEYAILVTDKEKQSKVINKETVDVLNTTVKDISDMRLVFVAKTKNDTPILDSVLLVTEPIDYAACFSRNNGITDITFFGKDESIISVKEVIEGAV